MTLIDSNILIDILRHDPVWLQWSAEQLDRCVRNGKAIINEIVYAELSFKAPTQAGLDGELHVLDVTFERVPKDALFLASKVFHRYRLAGGTKTGVLSDFFIGAHAHVGHMPILTRDTRRYRTYFPDVVLIAPND